MSKAVIEQIIKPSKTRHGSKTVRIKRGETTITLTNNKTGEVKVYHDKNMQTDAINDHLENLGWLNRDNLDQNNLAPILLGGVMAFNVAMAEDEKAYKVPSGAKMIANCGIGAVNAGTPTELGTASALTDETGWQDDGSFLVTYKWDDAHGNCTQETGPIRCVCACPQSYGLAGEGNGTSKVKTSSTYNVTGYEGSVSDGYTNIQGTPFHFDLKKSLVYSFDMTNAGTNHYGILRKYRLPINKINLKGSKTTLVQLPVEFDNNDDPIYDKQIAVPEAMYTAYLKYQPFDGKLLIWNAVAVENNDVIWGTNFTQYLWTLETDGTLTSETLVNTSGDSLHGIQNAIFDGNYIFFCPTYYQYVFESQWRYHNDTRTIYIMNRTTGTIDKYDNPYGNDVSGRYQDLGGPASGWMPYHCSGDGRIYISGYSYSYVVDSTGYIAPTNANTRNSSDYNPYITVEGLIKSAGAKLYRDQMFLSTINNLAEPLTKTADMSMVIQYRFIFEDDDEEAIGDIENVGGGE